MNTIKNEIAPLEITITGEASSNIIQYQESVLAQIESIGTKTLETDEDFSAAEQVVKICKEQEKKLSEATAEAKQQSASISDVFSAIEQASGVFRNTRLNLERQIKAEKEQRKEALLENARVKFAEKQSELRHRYGFTRLIGSNFGNIDQHFLDCIKGKKSFTLMQEALDQAVQMVCSDIESVASQQYANLAIIQGRQDQFLFQDAQAMCLLPTDQLIGEIERRESAHEERLQEERRKAAHEATLEEERKRQEAKKSEQEEAWTDEAQFVPDHPAHEPELQKAPIQEPQNSSAKGLDDQPVNKFKIKIDGVIHFQGTMDQARYKAAEWRDLVDGNVTLTTNNVN